jgi:dephospho-CoA kinase
MLTVGITGGIGSGKSLACRVFEWLGVPVYYADLRAKYLIANNPELKEKITALLGSEAYSNEGTYQTAWVAQQVFNNEKLMAKLNAIVHPAVKIDTQVWMEEQKKSGAPYVIKEAALLFESGAWKELNSIIYVYAPEKLRLARVQERDGMTKESFYQRVKSQWPENLKADKSQYIIYNDGSTSILKQIIDLHRTLLSSAQQTDVL